MPKTPPVLPPFDLPVTGADRLVASALTGARTDREIKRSAQHIRHHVNAEIATDDGLAKALASYQKRHGKTALMDYLRGYLGCVLY